MRKNIKNLFKTYGISPSKRLGQNFLISESILKKIVDVAEVSKKDVILEIGPGIGNLTTELAKRAKKVIAVEKDKRMIEILKESLKDFKNVKIIAGDALNTHYKLPTKNYKIVANIPYYLTSRLIRKFLETENKPKLMVLMLQKEVAQRICAKPPEMNLLAVSVQFYARPEIICFVSRNCFWPKPKVDSAILRISRISTNLSQIDTNLFFKIVRAGFSQPRKQISNNLSKMLKLNKKGVKEWLLENEIEPAQRAETLNIGDWIALTRNWYKM